MGIYIEADIFFKLREFIVSGEGDINLVADTGNINDNGFRRLVYYFAFYMSNHKNSDMGGRMWEVGKNLFLLPPTPYFLPPILVWCIWHIAAARASDASAFGMADIFKSAFTIFCTCSFVALP